MDNIEKAGCDTHCSFSFDVVTTRGGKRRQVCEEFLLTTDSTISGNLFINSRQYTKQGIITGIPGM